MTDDLGRDGTFSIVPKPTPDQLGSPHVSRGEGVEVDVKPQVAVGKKRMIDELRKLRREYKRQYGIKEDNEDDGKHRMVLLLPKKNIGLTNLTNVQVVEDAKL